MRRLYLFMTFIILLFPCRAYSATDSISLTTYYPAPLGSYDTFRLIPRTVGNDYSGACNNGTMYVKSTGDLQFCKNLTWGPIGGGSSSDLWLAGTNNRIYLNSPTYTKVGIGTTTPEFPLSLIGAGSIIATGTFGGGSDPTLVTSGAGTRLMWYTKKAAFRAGTVTGTQWDEANIGPYSAAFNYNTTASGEAATAIGSGTTASGKYAFSVGYNTVASGQASVAMGDTSTAAGATSFAVGNNAVTGVNATNAIAMGKSATANGANSMAFSTFNATANAPNSMAFGTNITVDAAATNSIGFGLGGAATVTQPNTLAIMGGKVTINSSPYFSLNVGGDGGILAIGPFGTAPTLPALPTGSKFIWYPRKAAFRAGYVSGANWDDVNIGNYSMAGGVDTMASGPASMAFGNLTTASGNASVAFGYNTLANNSYSTAMGYNTQATGQYSTALGYGSQASGDTAIAMGKNAIAQGARSLAIGEGITVTAAGTNSIGISLSSTANTVSQASTLAIMGGKVGIGVLAPTSTLAIAGLNSGTGTTLQIDGSGNVIKQASSRRYKKDIKPLQDDFSKILKVEPKSFVYKSSNEPDIGVIAEEIDELGLKNLVIYSKEKEPDGFKYDKTSLYLLMVVKDQQRKIERLEAIVCKDHPKVEGCK